MEKITVSFLDDLKGQFSQELTRETKPEASLPAAVKTGSPSLGESVSILSPITNVTRQNHIQQTYIETYCAPGIVLGSFTVDLTETLCPILQIKSGGSVCGSK